MQYNLNATVYLFKGVSLQQIHYIFTQSLILAYFSNFQLFGFIFTGLGVFFLVSLSISTVLSMEFLLEWLDICFRSIIEFLDLDEELIKSATKRKRKH